MTNSGLTAFDHETGSAADQAMDFAMTLRAFGQRRLGDGLLLLKSLAANLAFVFIGRNYSPPYCLQSSSSLDHRSTAAASTVVQSPFRLPMADCAMWVVRMINCPDRYCRFRSS